MIIGREESSTTGTSIGSAGVTAGVAAGGAGIAGT